MGIGGEAAHRCPTHNTLLVILRTFESLNIHYSQIHPNHRQATQQRILRCNDHDVGSC